MYDPFTATVNRAGVPYSGGRTAAEVAAGLLDEAARLTRLGGTLDEIVEYATDALDILREPEAEGR